jgi:adenylate cyclase, class 2
MTQHQTETEVKFCVHNLAGVKERLRVLTTHLIQKRIYEVNLRFDTSKGNLMRAGRVLRLRKDDLVRLTYKDNSQQIEGALTRREIEFVVNDFDSAKQFIQALGYEVVFIYEKFRTTFKYKGAQIMLDELPYGNFVEIEGKLKSLRPIAGDLHLDWDKAIPASYHALFERICKKRGLMFRDLTFENFKKIKVSPKDMMIEYADISKR